MLLQEDAVDDAEDRGICADAERQGEHGDGRECGAFRQHSGAENQVLPERSHETPPRTSPQGSWHVGCLSDDDGSGHWLWVSLIRVSQG